MIWKLFGNLIILYRIFCPWVVAQEKKHISFVSKLSRGLKKMLTATLGMFLQAVTGVRRWAVPARPADLHKPPRKRPEQAGVSTPEYVFQPEGTAFTMFPSWLLFKITATSQLHGPGVHTQLRRLVCKMSPPNLSLRRLVTASIPHWILTEVHFMLQIAA